MKAIFGFLILIASGAAVFFFGPVVIRKAKTVARTGHTRIGDFHIRIGHSRAHDKDLSPEDRAMIRRLESVEESLEAIDESVAEVEDEAEDFLADLDDEISRSERQLRKSADEIARLGAAFGNEESRKAKIAWARAAQDKHKALCAAMKTFRAQMVKMTRQWRALVREAQLDAQPETDETTPKTACNREETGSGDGGETAEEDEDPADLPGYKSGNPLNESFSILNPPH